MRKPRLTDQAAVAAALTSAKVPRSCHVYTPSDLAIGLVGVLQDVSTASWLEPCVGGGALLSALSTIGVPNERIVGVDLVRARSPSDALGSVLRATEFLKWSLERSVGFDRIVANPPYARLSSCSVSIRRAALKVSATGGIAIAGRANLWYAFLVAGLRLLNPDGNIGVILPASFEYAGYATGLRAALPRMFRRLLILRSSTSLFRVPPVEGGAVVLVGLGHRTDAAAPERSITERIEVSDLSGMVAALKALAQSSEVSRRSSARVLHLAPSIERFNRAVALRQVASVGIGAVTGHSRYFLLTEDRRRELGLPRATVLRAVSRRQHLACGSIDDESWNRLLAKGERVWLFRPSVRDAKSGSVQSYLQLPLEKGGCDRAGFKVSARSPWYRTAVPRRIHAIVSPAVDDVPHVAAVNGRFVATNTLYVLSFKRKFTAQQRAAVLLSLYLEAALGSLRALTRTYIGGLRKLEPSEFADLTIRLPHGPCLGASDCLKEVMAAVTKGDRLVAQSRAETWFAKTGSSSQVPNQAGARLLESVSSA